MKTQYKLSQLKVLPIVPWMKYHVRRKDKAKNCKWIIQTTPIVGKNGYYYSRHHMCCNQIFIGKWDEEETHLTEVENMVWFEYNGKAYALRGGVKQFKYDLATYSHKPMRDCNYKALTKLYNAKLLNKGMKSLLMKEEACRETRTLKRYIRKKIQYSKIYKLR